jgi:arylsulfatase A-like enzyme
MEWLDQNRDTKFFIFLHTYACHDPYERNQFLNEENVEGFIEQRRALYDGGVRHADKHFGRLIAKLRGLELLSKTIIVLVSDHGEDFHDHVTEADRIPPTPNPVPYVADRIDHGHTLYEELVNVFTVFHLPGLTPARYVFDNQIRLIDIMPTVLDYLGVQVHSHVQGASLIPLMEKGERPVEPPALSEFTLYGPERKSIRMNGYKYIYVPDPDERKDNVTFRDISQRSLYNLKSDPEERKNIVGDEMSIAEEYHGILEKIVEESHAIRQKLQEESESKEGDAPEQPRDVIEGLKALGYLD